MSAPAIIPFKSARHDNDSEPSDEALDNEAQRINVPLNPRAYDHIETITDEDRDLLIWFHQAVLDKHLTGTQVGEILGYDRTNAGRILRGTYPAKDWQPILKKVAAWKTRQTNPLNGIEIQSEFVPSADDDRLWHGMEYAARGGIAILAGKSGVGKTSTVIEWDRRNIGRMIRINAPISGGPSALLARIAHKMGMGWRKPNYMALHHAIVNRLTDRNILVIDEGTRIIPDAKKIQAKCLEELRDLSEETGCGVALILTSRAVDTMGELHYQIEQFNGRAELFVAIETPRDQVAGIAKQFGDFSHATITALHQLALKPGGLRTVVKVLNAANLAARKIKAPAVTDKHVAGAIKHRFERMGNKDPYDRK